MYRRIRFIFTAFTAAVILAVCALPACTEPENDPSASGGTSAETGGGGAEEIVAPDGGYVVITAKEGRNIYSPGGYRYGPSIISYTDGTLDIWFASTGQQPGEWDWALHRRFSDGGAISTNESLAIRPTPRSRDAYACCDPGVVMFGGWYYLGYTSTEDVRGVFNHVYVGRSRNATGPFDKWNGGGWGGDPQPIVTFDGHIDAWGAGEPSFVVVGDTLYIYYTWTDADKNQTRVMLADANNENWPATMREGGVCFDRVSGEDSADVKYIGEYGRFVQISTADRFSENSYIMVRQSFDGIKFEDSMRLYENIAKYCHNAGISGGPEGHINISEKNYIGYAYGSGGSVWGRWGTMLSEISFSLSAEPRVNVPVSNMDYEIPERVTVRPDRTAMIYTEKDIYMTKPGKKGLSPVVKSYSVNEKPANVKKDSPDLKFYGYDENIVVYRDYGFDAVGIGVTEVTAEFGGAAFIFRIVVTDADDPNASKYDEQMDLVEWDAAHGPCNLSNPQSVAGAKFEVDFNVKCLTFQMPTWKSDTVNHAVFRLYKWDGDYNTTVSGQPVAEFRRENIKDNEHVVFEIDEGAAPAGTYLWTISDAVCETEGGDVGIWYASAQSSVLEKSAEFFFNGRASKNYYKVRINGYM